MAVFLLGSGLVLLLGGAEALVRGASAIAERMGVSPLVIGLTVVAFGTSAPETAVSIGSSFAGQGDIALGNVVGSNIFNVLFILGLSALAAPLVVSHQLVRLDVPLMLGASIIVFALALDGTVGRFDGAVLLGGILIYTVFQIVQGRKAPPEEATLSTMSMTSEWEGRSLLGNQSSATNDATSTTPGFGVNRWVAGLLTLIGLGLLVLGAHWFVQGAVVIAEAMGLSELVIGLTIIAGGTSLPELATSILASIRGQRDIAVGNVVGSNIFNLLAVLGSAAVAAPAGVDVAPGVLWMDLPVMIAVAVACLPIFFTGYIVSRWEGSLFVAYYVAYTTYLIFTATAHPALSTFSMTVGLFVLPLTALGLGMTAFFAWRQTK
ncbi:sodium:calcium antiporter [Longibacter salinarum]|uniref:Sodium:calcium antiporter n=1 Tax=Longibacter salinarum TaxID=1850348 RepID=A0A2A8CXA8_9BACT|nr:calcium/sodium antiporter [Longibacter salinarum]PEN13286.1 sodium:calcium antiporter [Longibacter salinarum]